MSSLPANTIAISNTENLFTLPIRVALPASRIWGLTRYSFYIIIKRNILPKVIVMKTTDEVLKETGISYTMLTRLKDFGVIPRPQLQGKGEGGGRGVVGIFPDEVIEIIKWAKNEQEAGLSLSRIAEKWREREVIEEEITTSAPNPDKTRWAIDLFAKFLEKHPGCTIGSMTETPQPDGSVLVKVRLIKVEG